MHPLSTCSPEVNPIIRLGYKINYSFIYKVRNFAQYLIISAVPNTLSRPVLERRFIRVSSAVGGILSTRR
jgi:hypothetical protein